MSSYAEARWEVEGNMGIGGKEALPSAISANETDGTSTRNARRLRRNGTLWQSKPRFVASCCAVTGKGGDDEGRTRDLPRDRRKLQPPARLLLMHKPFRSPSALVASLRACAKCSFDGEGEGTTHLLDTRDLSGTQGLERDSTESTNGDPERMHGFAKANTLTLNATNRQIPRNAERRRRPGAPAAEPGLIEESGLIGALRGGGSSNNHGRRPGRPTAACD